MELIKSRSRTLIILLGLIAAIIYSQAQAASAPAEQTSVTLTHSSTSANPMSVSLTKNLFKTETYEAEYTVQVPYETTETYPVEIPYQTQETYVEQVPYTIEVPYTDYETDTRSEYKCHDRTSYRNECHNEQKCYLVPGRGGGGGQCRLVEECGTNTQGQRICKTREVCDGGSGGGGGSEQRCENHQVCQQVPYNEQQCGYENVTYRREVTRYRTETRYRNETRTRTVTKYRTEYRERTVTKHRTETRCCVTKTREVFDQQLSFQVSVAFPQDAVLEANEVETLKLSLVSLEPLVVQIQTLKSVYGYKILNQTVTGASVNLELALAPYYNLENAGPSTISGFKVDFSSTYDRHRMTFSDQFRDPGVASEFVLVITDAKTGQLIEELPASPFKDGKSVTRIVTALSKKTQIIATLKVRRLGKKMPEGGLLFEVTGKN